MQSFLQYRRIGLAVHKQISTDREKQANKVQVLQSTSQDQNHALSISPSTLIPTKNSGKELERIGSLTTVREQNLSQTDFDHTLNGLHVRDQTTHEGKGSQVIIVDWEGENDPFNPRNWSIAYRIWVTLIVGSISFVVGAAASADTAILPQAAAEFGVSDVVESLAIGIYLAGFAIGAMFAGPFSETFGRNAIYVTTMIIFMIFVMASALAPNIGAQLAFRFLAGVFGSTPLTCAGGSISDMWPSLEKTYAFPIFAIAGFGGPVLGPVMTSYVINLGSWRWAEWIILITSAVVLILVVLFQPETFPPLLLKWKAEHFRHETGDDRYRTEAEVIHSTLWARLKVALTRPLLFTLEPIVLFFTLYLTTLYVVLFTFLDGYPYIFQKVYGTSQGLTNVIFTAMFVGILLVSLLIPWVYAKTKEDLDKNAFVPERRLWFAMFGAPAIPISVFWLAWTDFPNINIWSPILASTLFGYGLISIFMTAYMYIIDSYEIYAASALTFVTVVRYMLAGGMTVVGVPFYQNLGPHLTLTILGCVSVVMTPIPYVFYRWGHMIRLRSKYAVYWS